MSIRCDSGMSERKAKVETKDTSATGDRFFLKNLLNRN